MKAPTTQGKCPSRPDQGTLTQPKGEPQYTAPNPDTHTDFGGYPGTKRWLDDWHRRCIRASVDPNYWDMCPLGVRLQANLIRARLAGGDA
jgi:hypothetical protein